MIDTNTDTNSGDFSLVARGRALLEQGDIASAVECYGKAYDPESLDESEARNMLIEARACLSRKHLLEALENFEEALLMGTEVQRRQALEGISTVGRIKSQINRMSAELKAGLAERLGERTPLSVGLALVSDEENVVIVSDEAFGRLPTPLAKAVKMAKLPPHLADYELPFPATRCILFTEEEDLRYTLEVASSLAQEPQPEQQMD